MSDKRTRGICTWVSFGGLLSMTIDLKVGVVIAMTALLIAVISLWTEGDSNEG